MYLAAARAAFFPEGVELLETLLEAPCFLEESGATRGVLPILLLQSLDKS